MALAPHSNFLSNHETISCHVESKLQSHKRFSCARTDYFGTIVIVKICSRRQIPTYLPKSPKIRFGLDSRGLQLSSQGKQNLSSAHSVNQNVPKVTFDKIYSVASHLLLSEGMWGSSSVLCILFILFFLFADRHPLFREIQYAKFQKMWLWWSGRNGANWPKQQL